MAERPEIDFPDFDPPSELQVTDLVVGDGPEATSGAQVSMHYVGVAHSTGEQFDASWDRGTRWTSGSASARSSPAGTRACPA